MGDSGDWYELCGMPGERDHRRPGAEWLQELSDHAIGPEYGWLGQLLAVEVAAREFAVSLGKAILAGRAVVPLETSVAHGKLAALLGDDA